MAKNEVETVEVDEKAERAEALAAQAEKLNEGLTGKGLRWFVGLSKGRNPQPVPYKGFDESKPETIPETFDEFMALSTFTDEKLILSFCIDGMNAYNFSLASDPIAAFVDAAWEDETVKAFKLAVKNYAAQSETSIEDAVALMKPGFDKAFAKRQKLAAEAKAANDAATESAGIAPVATPTVTVVPAVPTTAKGKGKK